MKKFVIFAIICFCVSNTVNAAQFVSFAPGDREVVIRDVITVPIKQIPRSSLPTVQAYVDTDFNQLELTFNMEVGVVQVTVLCDGMAVASATCDTSVQDFVCLSVPSAPGFYTIDIVSDQYEGEGEYTLTDI